MDEENTDKNNCVGVNFDIEVCDLDIMADDSNDGVFDPHTDQLLIAMDEKLMREGMESQSSEIVDEEPPAKVSIPDKSTLLGMENQSSEIVDEEPPAKVSKPDKSQLLEFIDKGLNKNTKIKTKKDAEKFLDFVKSQGETRDLTELSQSELDFHFGSYIMQLRKPDGDFYEPSTITSIHR